MPNLFTFNMLRPYFDLGPLQNGPLHARRPQLFAQVLDRENPEVIGLSMWMVSGFRERAIIEAGAKEYNAATPDHLPQSIRTPLWAQVCSRIDSFPSLSTSAQLGVVQLLAGLCFYPQVVALVNSLPDLRSEQSPAAAALVFHRSLADTLLRESEGQEFADVDTMLTLAHQAPSNSQTRVNAALWLVRHFARLGDKAAAIEWLQAARSLIDARAAWGDDFNAAILLTAYWRAVSGMRAAEGDWASAREALDRGVALARTIPRDYEDHSWIADEALHRLLDRAVQHELGHGDLESALMLAQEQVQVDPYNGKARYQLAEALRRSGRLSEAAEAYTTAAHLGPFSILGTAQAWYYAGMCYEQLDRPELACDCYLECARHDALSVSGLERLRVLAHRIGLNPVAHWAGDRLEALALLR